jgi:hypothetical protein
MAYEIAPEVIAQAKFCKHNHECLNDSAVFPLCKVVSKRTGACVIIEPKFGMIPYCGYNTSIEGKTSESKINTCFCSVRKEIFLKYGE